MNHRSTPKAEWSANDREHFMSRLLRLGWRLVQEDGDEDWFAREGLTILVDQHGVFLYEGGQRKFGLSDNYCDNVLRNQLGPLCVNPFSANKRYVWLGLDDCKFEGKRR